MNVTELWEGLPSYMQGLCRQKREHREGIANDYKLSPIQCEQFYAICLGDNSTETKSCQEIDKTVEKYDKNNNKIISIQCDGAEKEVHYKLKTLQCFTSCTTPAAQNIK
eukprot:313726_1